MMHFNEIAALRTQLRTVNIEYSALVRLNAGEGNSGRLDELRARRRTLMELISEAKRRPPLRPSLPIQAQPDVVVQAA